MTPEFNAWWDADIDTTDNPYEEGSPAFWAWEGWQAGVKTEREACIKIVESIGKHGITVTTINVIRARGNQ